MTARIVAAFLAVALALCVIFVLLIVAVVGLRHRSLEARHSQQVIATANAVQTLAIDLETGLRGFVITNRERYLQPWRTARLRYPGEIRKLLQLTADNPRQHTAARDIKSAIDTYITFYSLPLVQFMRRNPGAARQVVAAGRGAQQVEQIRARFARFLASEERLGAARDVRARRTAHRAVIFGVIALAAVLLFLLAAGIYLARAVARPIREAAFASRRVAAGDLSVRLPTGGPGEVGMLENTFNAMADSLQRSRDDLEERNRRLVESERLKSELVSSVSHELRTPLASVLGFSDLMLKRDVDPASRRRYLEVIRSESARLATLLNDLLDLQRHERGILELNREEFDLNDLLGVQVTLYSAQSEVHEVRFVPADEMLLVDADRDRLAQVVGNLISNAIKYSPDGGVVTITSGPGRGDAWVWVRDEGLGIAHDHQRMIFTKFFRGDAARKRGIAGTGLGLVLSQQIVEAHGGEIGFDSEEGRGSTFWIRIPLADRASSAARDDAQAGHRM